MSVHDDESQQDIFIARVVQEGDPRHQKKRAASATLFPEDESLAILFCGVFDLFPLCVGQLHVCSGDIFFEMRD